MRLTVVSSLDALCRQQACETLAESFPDAVVVVQDVLDGGVVLRRTFRHGAPVEREETRLEHPCPSCAVRLDVVPAMKALHALEVEQAVIGLAPTVSASTAIKALERGLGHPFTVDSVALACAAAAVEDQIWDGQTLFEIGATVLPDDERTSGDFLIGELSFVDTVLLADPALVSIDPDQRQRGVQLLRELARHADIVGPDSDVRPDRRRSSEARRRWPSSGQPELSVAPPAPSPFTTVVHELARPLHPQRFHQALAAVAPGCCWLRGQLWMAVIPECRIALHGIGPKIWLENTGPWPLEEHTDPPTAEHAAGRSVPDSPGRHGSAITATGENLDAAYIRQLLDRSQITEAEMRSGITGLADPFGLNATHEIDNRRTT